MSGLLRWLIARAIELLPETAVRVLLPKKYRFRAAAVPPAPAPPQRQSRLYIAPVNWAGQAWAWARAAERDLVGVGAVVMAYRVGGEFGHPADQTVPVGAYVASRRWQRAQREAVLGGFTHMIVEAERHPFGAIFGQTVAQQVAESLGSGLAVAMLCHGTDIRLPSRHAAENADSPFAPGRWSMTPRLERSAAANRALLDSLGLPVFVSTPDLLLDVPYARWLPVVIEPERWIVSTPPLERAIPVVLHAPSRAIVKGSDLIDPVLRRLEAEGVIVYRRVSGVAAAEMPSVLGEADIVVDQLRIGDYGVAACEALAAGRVVVSHVSGHSRALVASTTGLELPIVEVTAATLEATIRDIANDRARYRELAGAGARFARAVHDGRLSSGVLGSFLETTG